jgi:hypothetical protein
MSDSCLPDTAWSVAGSSFAEVTQRAQRHREKPAVLCVSVLLCEKAVQPDTGSGAARRVVVESGGTRARERTESAESTEDEVLR